jgi:hydroxymethylpyrimidine/phosphomethylpyrimidine kinase
VTIAGSDSGGGAGIQADLKTFSALGVYGASVITAVTAQNTQGVTAIHDIPPEIIRAQFAAVFEDLRVNAVKIGMLSRPEAIDAVADGLDAYPSIPAVLDPVMVATSGDVLISAEAIAGLTGRLLRRCLLVTPNLHEAAILSGMPLAASEGEMETQARVLLDKGAQAVLIKGGHRDTSNSTDLLVTPRAVARLTAQRIATVNTHGTGCTLSSAVAAGLARGLGLEDAVAAAKAYVGAAIAAADRLAIGQGHGPTHHFHAFW